MALTNLEKTELVELLDNKKVDAHAGVLGVFLKARNGDLEVRTVTRIRELLEKI